MQGATGCSKRLSRLHTQGIGSMGHTIRLRTACLRINEHSVSKQNLTSGLLLLSNCSIISLLNLVLLASPSCLSRENILIYSLLNTCLSTRFWNALVVRCFLHRPSFCSQAETGTHGGTGPCRRQKPVQIVHSDSQHVILSVTVSN